MQIFKNISEKTEKMGEFVLMFFASIGAILYSILGKGNNLRLLGMGLICLAASISMIIKHLFFK